MAEKLYKDPSKDLPAVAFDGETGKLEIYGNSYPADVRVFYNPLIEWLKHYISNPADQSQLHFKFDYFNTASSKMILGLVDTVRPLYDQQKLTVFWHYPDDDPDMKEFGDVMQEVCGITVEMEEYVAEDDEDF